MELEFLDAFSESAKIAVKLVLFLARDMQATIGARNKEPITNATKNYQADYGSQYLPRQPPEKRCATQEYGDIYADNRDRQQGLRDVENVISQSNKNSGRADLLQIAQWHCENLANQPTAQLSNRPLRKTGKHDLRTKIREQFAHANRYKPADEYSGCRPSFGESSIDNGDKP